MPVDPDELLNRQLRVSKLLVQCWDHQDKPITTRPPTCVLCHADQRRALERVLDINEFLTTWRNDATALIKELRNEKNRKT